MSRQIRRHRLSVPGRVVAVLPGLLFGLLAVVCGGDGDGGSSNDASEAPGHAQACADFQAAQGDIDDLKRAVVNNDRAAATQAVNDAQESFRDLRSSAGGQLQGGSAQSAADLSGAVQGLQTTIRQAEQGASVVGVVQQLAIQLPAIVSSLDSLRSDLSCS